MRQKFMFLILMTAFLATPGFPQQKTKKELRAEKKIEAQKHIEEMMNYKEFRFVGMRAFPTGMRSVNLSSNPNYLKFTPDFIESRMPFFGRAYSGIGYGTDTGLKFSGKPEKFEIVKTTKSYEVKTEVRGPSDSFNISLIVGLGGGASLTITSNNRSSISYQGDIFPLD